MRADISHAIHAQMRGLLRREAGQVQVGDEWKFAGFLTALRKKRATHNERAERAWNVRNVIEIYVVASSSSIHRPFDMRDTKRMTRLQAYSTLALQAGTFVL